MDNVVIHEPLGSSDHNQLHFNIKIKSDKTQVKQCSRDFRKGTYKAIRTSLAHIDWNDQMKNKTATECWNILRGELDIVEQITCIFGVNRANSDTSAIFGMGHLYGN